jgi:hypothetical protein
MESTGNCQWFVEMAVKLGHELWIGDAAKIRACEVRAQKHDRRDAAHQYWVSRDRSCQEQLAGAAGQRKLDRGIDWALSPRFTPEFG